MPDLRINHLRYENDPIYIAEDWGAFPGSLDYKTGLRVGLEYEIIDYFGLRVGKIFSQTLDADTYEEITPEKVVFESYEYIWDAINNLPIRRLKHIKYYDADGTLYSEEPPKPMPKSYASATAREEVLTKARTSQVNWLIGRSLELGLIDPNDGEGLAKKFFLQYDREVERYKNVGDNTIIAIVDAATEPWFDLDSQTALGTVRQSISFSLNKALAIPTKAEIDAFLVNYE